MHAGMLVYVCHVAINIHFADAHRIPSCNLSVLDTGGEKVYMMNVIFLEAIRETKCSRVALMQN